MLIELKSISFNRHFKIQFYILYLQTKENYLHIIIRIIFKLEKLHGFRSDIQKWR